MAFAFKNELGEWVEIDDRRPVEIWNACTDLVRANPNDPENTDMVEVPAPGLILPGFFAVASAEELALNKIVEIVDPGASAAEGQQIASRTVIDEDGVPTFAYTYEDIPAPALPDQVPMYKVKKYMALVKAQTGGATDLHAGVMAFINALPEPNRTMARIDFGPDPEQIGSPNLVTGSGLAQGAKAALSLTDEEYATLVLAADALP